MVYSLIVFLILILAEQLFFIDSKADNRLQVYYENKIKLNGDIGVKFEVVSVEQIRNAWIINNKYIYADVYCSRDSNDLTFTDYLKSGDELRYDRHLDLLAVSRSNTKETVFKKGYCDF